MNIKTTEAALHLLDYIKEWPIDLSSLSSDEQQEVQTFLKREFPKRIPSFKQNIQYLSDSFTDQFLAEIKSRKQLFPPDPLQETGIFILNGKQGIKGTIFYDVDVCTEYTSDAGPKDIRNVHCMMLFVLTPKGQKFARLFSLIYNRPEHPLGFHPACISSDQILKGILGLILYKHHCAVETRYVEPGQNLRRPQKGSQTGNGLELVNQTQFPIKVLDSSWFTTTIQTKGIMVGESTGGFMKMQPCGPGNKDRRLTYVAPYERKPQIKEAKVLTHKRRKLFSRSAIINHPKPD